MAILASIDAIAEYNSDVAPTGVDLGAAPPTSDAGRAAAASPTGDFQPDTIVVLTDGANTEGVLPLVAAEQAAVAPRPGLRHRVRHDGAVAAGVQHRPARRRPRRRRAVRPRSARRRRTGGPGGRRFLQIDEETLQGVADLTGGQYFRAEDADQLDDVFRQLPNEVVRQQVDEELSVWFVLAAAVLAAAAIGLSLWWNRYP